MKSLLAALLLFLSSALLHAARESDEAPRIVVDGFEAYKTYGLSAGLDAWLKGSPLEGDPQARNAIQTIIEQSSTSYGRMTGYELLKVVTLAPSVRRVYAVLLHEKGPLYVWFECYQSSLGWIIPRMEADLKAEVALPASIVNPQPAAWPGRGEKDR